MLLDEYPTTQDGRRSHKLYSSLRASIDRARDHYRAKFLAAGPIPDFLHEELVRSLARAEAACSVRNIPVRWLSFAAAFTLIANAQTVSRRPQLRRASYSAGREALVRFAAAHPKDASGAIALLAIGSADLASQTL